MLKLSTGAAARGGENVEYEPRGPLLFFVYLIVVNFCRSLAYATQMPGTATFWNRCGDATAEDG